MSCEPSLTCPEPLRQCGVDLPIGGVCRGYGPYPVTGAMPVAWHQKNDANAPGVAAQSVHAWRMRSISSALAQPWSRTVATSSGLLRIEYM